MRNGPQIIDGADLGTTALGAMENPLPNLLVHVSTLFCGRSCAADIVKKEVPLRVG